MSYISINNDNIIKIAILGRGGVGKNTLASIITEILNLQKNEYKISAFANHIKKIIQVMFPGCDREALYGASELRQNKISSELDIELSDSITYRQVSCDLGKLGRQYNDNLWIAHITRDLKNLPHNIKLFIISDLRFINEFQWAKNNGFMLCRIKRSEKLELNDISETEQDSIEDNKFDIIIENNGSLDELKHNTKIALNKYYSNNKTYLQVINATIR